MIFKLINNQHKDIFAVLCEDLISSISSETNEKKLVTTLLNRFEKWKSLFNKFTLEGLTPINFADYITLLLFFSINVFGISLNLANFNSEATDIILLA